MKTRFTLACLLSALPLFAADQPGGDYLEQFDTLYNSLTVERTGMIVELRARSRGGQALESAVDLSWVQIDLSRSNGAKVRQWTRRIGLAQRQAVLISDSVRSDMPVEAMWSMLTEAEITLAGSTATLHRGGWVLAAEIRTPRHAVFDITPARAPAGQTPTANFRRLIVRLGDKITDVELSIVLTPYRDGQAKPKITTQFPV